MNETLRVVRPDRDRLPAADRPCLLAGVTAIGHSSWRIGAPSGQSSRSEPHHSSPIAGRRPQNVGGSRVEERDHPVRIGRVHGDAERVEELPVAVRPRRCAADVRVVGRAVAARDDAQEVAVEGRRRVGLGRRRRAWRGGSSGHDGTCWVCEGGVWPLPGDLPPIAPECNDIARCPLVGMDRPPPTADPRHQRRPPMTAPARADQEVMCGNAVRGHVDRRRAGRTWTCQTAGRAATARPATTSGRSSRSSR